MAFWPYIIIRIYDNIPTRQFSDATIFRNQRSRQYSDATIFRCDNFPTTIFRCDNIPTIFKSNVIILLRKNFFVGKFYKTSRKLILKKNRNFVASEFCRVGILSPAHVSEFCRIGILSRRNFVVGILSHRNFVAIRDFGILSHRKIVASEFCRATFTMYAVKGLLIV